MNNLKRLPAQFFESGTGDVPLRGWLLSLSQEDRKIIGDDIRAFQGMIESNGDSILI